MNITRMQYQTITGANLPAHVGWKISIDAGRDAAIDSAVPVEGGVLVTVKRIQNGGKGVGWYNTETERLYALDEPVIVGHAVTGTL